MFAHVHFEGVSGCPKSLTARLLSITSIGGSLSPMKIHIVTSYVIVSTFEDLATNKAQVSTSNGLGICSKLHFKT